MKWLPWRARCHVFSVSTTAPHPQPTNITTTDAPYVVPPPAPQLMTFVPSPKTSRIGWLPGLQRAHRLSREAESQYNSAPRHQAPFTVSSTTLPDVAHSTVASSQHHCTACLRPRSQHGWGRMRGKGLGVGHSQRSSTTRCAHSTHTRPIRDPSPRRLARWPRVGLSPRCCATPPPGRPSRRPSRLGSARAAPSSAPGAPHRASSNR